LRDGAIGPRWYNTVYLVTACNDVGPRPRGRRDR